MSNNIYLPAAVPYPRSAMIVSKQLLIMFSSSVEVLKPASLMKLITSWGPVGRVSGN